MTVFYGVLIFWIGAVLGFVTSRWMLVIFKEYAGTIVVSRSERGDKTLYSLILEDDPTNLEFKDDVMFKIVISEQSFNLSNDRN